MAIKISGDTIVTDSKVLQNVTGFKTVNSQGILGTGDIVTSGNYAMRIFTGSATWSKPNNLKSVKVTVVGGGGSSANVSGTWNGGGGGGTAIKYIDASALPATVAVTVGEAGITTNPAVLSGNTSFFGEFCSATGGVTGRSPSSPGGSGVNGSINIPGEPGSGSRSSYYTYSIQTTNPGPTPQGPITTNNPASFVIGTRGKGGNSLLGFGGIIGASSAQGSGTQTVTLPAVQGQGYGAGASGQIGGTVANGTPGVVIVEEFY